MVVNGKILSSCRINNNFIYKNDAIIISRLENMKEPKSSEIKKYLNAILKLNKKYVTTERLSRVVGHYPEVIAETLSYFEPMLLMDTDYNLMELVPALKDFLVKKEENKSLTPRPAAVRKKDVKQYDSIYDFIYRKMTNAGGLLDRNAELSDIDLRILKKLIAEEQARRKK